MALLLVALAAAAAAAALFLQGGPQRRSGGLVFEPRILDLGEIALGSSRSGEVTVRNPTPAPLAITIAAPSCGCTKVTWPQEPIPPGGSASATVTMTPPGKAGITEERTVTFVAEGDQREVVLVRAKVVPAVDASAAPMPAPGTGAATAPTPPPADTYASLGRILGSPCAATT